jgi:hypothetical protein
MARTQHNIQQLPVSKHTALLQRLAEYRVRNGLTWFQLAAELKALSGVGGIHESTLRLACNSSQNITDRIAGKIERFLERVTVNAS